MPEGIHDARMRELAFLARLERETLVTLPSEQLYRDPLLKSIAISLLREGYVNGLDSMPWQPGTPVSLLGAKPNVLVTFELRLWQQVAAVLSDQETALRISHRGRVRRSELELFCLRSPLLRCRSPTSI
jgi:hypothetical protein